MRGVGRREIKSLRTNLIPGKRKLNEESNIWEWGKISFTGKILGFAQNSFRSLKENGRGRNFV
jgi:hypothetical protein